ncbi:MAG: BMP family ABC transporter substrate-binding protein [Oscillospiraceae bacterium]|nr:BMP family ABC transporter substrate-binding protein [Oscillospiraceae bacterium]
MKKLIALLLACVMVLGLVACGGNAPETTAPADGTTPETTAPADGESTPETTAPAVSEVAYKVAMITDYGDITDQSFNQTTWEAVKAFGEANGIEYAYYRPQGDSDAERVGMIDAAIADGFNVIVLPGFAFGNAIKETAPIYPDVLFFALDVSAADFGDWEIPANVYSAVYQEELSGYMAGYAAVKLGYKHLGYLGGMAVPAVMRFGYGYLQGIEAAAAELGITGEITVEYVYGNQFFGDADITAVMDTWYGEKGVEIVFACGGGIWSSAAEAAAKVNGKVIGVDVDQAAIIDGTYGVGMTVTSAMKGLYPTTVDTLTDVVLNGNWAAYGGKIATLGLVSADPEANYVQIPMGSTQFAEGFTAEDYKALVAGMFDGTITVSNDISAMPAVTYVINVYADIK